MKYKQKLINYAFIGTIMALGAGPVAQAETTIHGVNLGVFGGVNSHTGTVIGISSSNTNPAGGVEANYRFPSNAIQVGAEFFTSGGDSRLMAKFDFYPAEPFFIGAMAGTTLGSGQNFVWGAEAGFLFELGDGLQLGPKVEYATGNTGSGALSATGYDLSAAALLRYNFSITK